MINAESERCNVSASRKTPRHAAGLAITGDCCDRWHGRFQRKLSLRLTYCCFNRTGKSPMRRTMMGRAELMLLAVAVITASHSGLAQSPQNSVQDNVLTYHGSPDRRGNFVVPGLTWQRAKSLHLDE